jgi:hypothetical protein
MLIHISKVGFVQFTEIPGAEFRKLNEISDTGFEKSLTLSLENSLRSRPQALEMY